MTDSTTTVDKREYWIIDRFHRRMTAYTWVESEWTKRQLPETETYTTDLLPGFELALEKLFAVADRHGAAESGGPE